jgi:hypothetical protein
MQEEDCEKRARLSDREREPFAVDEDLERPEDPELGHSRVDLRTPSA